MVIGDIYYCITCTQGILIVLDLHFKNSENVKVYLYSTRKCESSHQI